MANQSESLRSLKYKRGYVKSTLTKFNSFISSLNAEDLDEIQIRTRLPKIKDLWEEFHNIQAQIQCLDDSEAESDSQEVDNFESNYFNAIASAERLLSNHSKIPRSNSEAKSNVSSSAKIQNIQGQIRLPQISLPAFSGTFEEWIPFFDTFSSLIHTNETLSEIQKFHYLKSCLKCEAANCIQELPISKQNYAIAWTTLKDRYDNKRLIIRKHIQSIHELPVCAHENAVTLRQIIDGVQKHTRALNSLGRPTEQWDDWLTYLIANKLDRMSNKEWESSLKVNHIPTAKELLEFLSHKCNALEAISKGSASVYATVNKVNKYQKSSLACISNQSSQCVICKASHSIYHCADFLKLSVEQRLKEVKRCKLCNNCLRSGHFSSKCISGHCSKCPQKHNTLLHVPEQSIQPADQSPASTSVSESIVAHSIRYPRPTQVLLATAIIEVRDQGQEFHKCRAVLDSGSQSNFISRSFAEKLGLKFNTVNIPLCGIGQTHSRISKAVSARIKSQYNAFSCELSCLVIDQITNNIPVSTLSKGTIDIPRKLSLADPEFHVSRKVDMLIGAELFWQLLCVGQAKLPNTNVIMQKTHLGWIISGSIVAPSSKLYNVKSCNILVDQSLDLTLRKFWELEEFSITNGYSSEEIACEKHFTETHKRDQTGRFVVKLPFKINPHTLGESKDLAINRFHSLERRLAKQPLLKQQYDEFIHEYIRLGHMKVINDNGDSENAFYLPHHAVVKGHSLTTKLRVVFDASAKTTSGKSLNDILLTGPCIQQDLFSIVCRFRTHKIVLTADVAKMYRQVLVDDEDAKWQRFIWRFHPNEHVSMSNVLLLKTYELKTVTYGTALASFLATRALKQVALEGARRFPGGSEIALRDSYVDDLLTGADTMTDIEASFKANPVAHQPPMGNLPKFRVEPARPFLNVGVDFCGPFTVRNGAHRRAATTKAYVSIFVCMATKAVHIELVPALDADSFLRALKRFTSRRGLMANIYSDNGTNFVKANKELKDLRRLFASEASGNPIITALTSQGIKWNFIPPRAPHFGGIWEAAVKSFKYHFKRITGNAFLTYEEMYTIITQIESILNSRPLIPLSDDPNDLSVLTPGHFLIGDSLRSNLEPNLIPLKINRLSRLQLLERIRQHFWQRWSREYLQHLQQRHKWNGNTTPPLQVGQLVIIREDNAPPALWSTGRIVRVHPGDDGGVRVVTLKTVGGEFKRPANRLCLLPVNSVREPKC